MTSWLQSHGSTMETTPSPKYQHPNKLYGEQSFVVERHVDHAGHDVLTGRIGVLTIKPGGYPDVLTYATSVELRVDGPSNPGDMAYTYSSKMLQMFEETFKRMDNEYGLIHNGRK